MGDTAPKKVKSVVSTCPCHMHCWTAREEVCRCSCDGKYHGKWYSLLSIDQEEMSRLLAENGLTKADVDQYVADKKEAEIKRIETLRLKKEAAAQEAQRAAQEAQRVAVEMKMKEQLERQREEDFFRVLKAQNRGGCGLIMSVSGKEYYCGQYSTRFETPACSEACQRRIRQVQETSARLKAEIKSKRIEEGRKRATETRRVTQAKKMQEKSQLVQAIKKARENGGCGEIWRLPGSLSDTRCGDKVCGHTNLCDTCWRGRRAYVIPILKIYKEEEKKKDAKSK